MHHSAAGKKLRRDQMAAELEAARVRQQEAAGRLDAVQSAFAGLQAQEDAASAAVAATQQMQEVHSGNVVTALKLPCCKVDACFPCLVGGIERYRCWSQSSEYGQSQ